MTIRIRARNYKVLRNVDWSPPAGAVSLVVGANGSGKTTLLSILDLLRNALERGLSEAMSLEYFGGPAIMRNDRAAPEEPFELGVELGDSTWHIAPSFIPSPPAVALPLAETVTHAGQEVFRQLASSSKCSIRGQTMPAAARAPRLGDIVELLRGTQPGDGPILAAALGPLVQTVRGYRHYQNPHLWRLRTEGSPTSSKTELHPTGADAFAVLRNWVGERRRQERADFVRDGLRRAFPSTFEDFDFEPGGPTQPVAWRFYEPRRDAFRPAFQAPHGLLAALLHLCAVASTDDNGVCAIDEFENSLHPHAIQELLDHIGVRARRRGITVLLATHSPVVLAAFGRHPERVFVAEELDGTFPVPLDKHSNPDWLAQFSLGDLFSQGDFGGQRPPPKRVPEGERAPGSP